MKKACKIGLLSVLAIIIALIVGTGIMFGSKIAAAMSVEQLDEKLYTLEFKGDYGFDALLEAGGAKNSDDIRVFVTEYFSNGFWKAPAQEPQEAFACSTISAKGGDGKLLGRNFDWPEECLIMVVRTQPKNGYKSISTTNLNFLGFGPDWKPEDSMINKIMALSSIYIPLDGINEKGLAIADLTAGHEAPAHQDDDKVNITTTMGIRMILDKAATVDEALELLRNHNMHSDLGFAHHYAISDANGKAVVVEWVDNQMYVKETPVVANHNLTDNYACGIGSENSHTRQAALENALAEYNYNLDEEAVLDAINRSSNPHTRWQTLFNQSEMSYNIYLTRSHEPAYSFKIN